MSLVGSSVDVLLVEDNPTDAELCIRALKKMNLANDLVWVTDGAEALDFLLQTGAFTAAERNRRQVVLLDLRLPKIDGLEVLRQAKSNHRTKTIPFAVLTSSKENRDVQEAYELGANNYISKPVEFEAFVETIGKLGFYRLAINKPLLETKSA